MPVDFKLVIESGAAVVCSSLSLKVEKYHSTLAVEKGKLKSNSLINKMFGHFMASFDEYSWFQIFLWLYHIQSKVIVNDVFILILRSTL